MNDTSLMKNVRSIVAANLMVVFGAASAFAAPILITGQLTGDPRPENPDNLFIDVTIQGDTTSNTVAWTVDINSLLHPTARLAEFYFNLSGLSSNYTFGGFNPTGWDVSSPASEQGGGNIDFLFEASDPNGQPKAGDVTNGVNLTFNVSKTIGLFSAEDFLNATSSCSTNQTLGCGQMGAHLISLGTRGNESGFVLGNYEGGGNGTVPEPNSLALVSLALASIGILFGRRVRKSRQS